MSKKKAIGCNGWDIEDTRIAKKIAWAESSRKKRKGELRRKWREVVMQKSREKQIINWKKNQE